jgi:hypothetical protein
MTREDHRESWAGEGGRRRGESRARGWLTSGQQRVAPLGTSTITSRQTTAAAGFDVSSETQDVMPCRSSRTRVRNGPLAPYLHLLEPFRSGSRSRAVRPTACSTRRLTSLGRFATPSSAQEEHRKGRPN